jgi:hypothetical protein
MNMKEPRNASGLHELKQLLMPLLLVFAAYAVGVMTGYEHGRKDGISFEMTRNAESFPQTVKAIKEMVCP